LYRKMDSGEASVKENRRRNGDGQLVVTTIYKPFIKQPSNWLDNSDRLIALLIKVQSKFQ
jgi:hypothetical protein